MKTIAEAQERIKELDVLIQKLRSKMIGNIGTSYGKREERNKDLAVIQSMMNEKLQLEKV